jgi:hypothetical protein
MPLYVVQESGELCDGECASSIKHDRTAMAEAYQIRTPGTTIREQLNPAQAWSQKAAKYRFGELRSDLNFVQHTCLSGLALLD